jgi:formylglycine-generating enzyme required for sulfatase activity
VGEVAGHKYLAMAYLEGHTLAELLKNNPPLIEQALAIIGQVAAALDTIHSQGLVHRDVKPGNIILTGEGRAVLLDFGLVRAAEGTRLTQSMASLGTAEYMAPEQIEQAEETKLDGRADIYALGVMAYEILVGRLPFIATSSMKLLYKHLHETPPSPTSLKPDLPPGLEPSLFKALAKAPEARFQRARELAQALKLGWQENNLDLLYQRLQAAANQQDWIEVLILGGQITALQPRFRDVPEQLSQARAALNKVPQPQPVSPSPEPPRPPAQPTQSKLQQKTTDRLIWEKDGKTMVRVPAGEFLYGDKKVKKSLPEFWIDKTPVTNAEYARFIAETKQNPPGHWKGKEPSKHVADHPVAHISWNEAVAYAKWAGKRLPTEEEWEKAARGVDGRKYPWGDQPPTSELCNFNRNIGGTTPVGRYSPQGDSPYGCVDMSGNVWECTVSDYNKGTKVLRGGSWYYTSEEILRAAYRNYHHPDGRYETLGFRCVGSLGSL